MTVCPKLIAEASVTGLDTGALPYSFQDDYGHRLAKSGFKVAVLENDVLRATFLLEYGGRLWSLYHKLRRRELLYTNPVFQPANFAIRDAWFTGGVEWNVSVRGHCPFTCSPLFVSCQHDEQGNPSLRMYEWERIRGVPFQLDFSLPDGSSFLLVHVKIVNPHHQTIPMYWWSNIALPEAPSHRILVPATEAITFGYKEGNKSMEFVSIPIRDKRDVTYPTNGPAAADYFYCVENNPRAWITSLDENGSGLIQTSTSFLRGRKLFILGMGKGGRRWQDFLSVPGETYIELQAGLCKTQMECTPMPPRAQWSWLEAYGLMEADASVVHGSDWERAYRHVEGRLSDMLPADQLEEAYKKQRDIINRPAENIVQRGSGWGALERRRREVVGETPMCSGSMIFDDVSLTEDQQPWLDLLTTGTMKEYDPNQKPGGWIVQQEWGHILERAVDSGCKHNWLAWLYLGVMKYHGKEFQEAKEAWSRSLSLQSSVYVFRNLAILAEDQNDLEQAIKAIAAAYEMSPNHIPLAAEYMQMLLKARKYQRIRELFISMSEELKSHGRIQALAAMASLKLGDLTEVEQFLMSGVEVPNIREGETILTDMWFELHEKRLADAEDTLINDSIRTQVRHEYHPPFQIDFRMYNEG